MTESTRKLIDQKITKGPLSPKLQELIDKAGGVLFPEQVERARALLLEHGTPPNPSPNPSEHSAPDAQSEGVEA